MNNANKTQNGMNNAKKEETADKNENITGKNNKKILAKKWKLKRYQAGIKIAGKQEFQKQKRKFD